MTFAPLVSLRKHWLLAAVIIVVTAAAGVMAAWSKGTPVYLATAVVYVAPRFASILEENKELEFQSNSQYRQFVEQQVRTINRYDIVLEALEELGERRFAWQDETESLRRAAERLQGALQIRAVRDTYLVTVTLESEQADGLDELVNAVVQNYLEKVREEDLYASDVRIANLSEQRQKLLQEIEQKVQRRTELAQEMGVTTFAENSLNPYDKLLIDSTEAQTEARRRRIAAAAVLQTLNGDDGAGKAALDALAREQVAKDPGLNSLKANLYKRRSEILEQITGLGPAHPVRKKAERELSDLEAEVTAATTVLSDSVRDMLVQQRLADLRQALTIERELRSEVTQQREKAAWFITRYNEALALNDEIDRARKQLEAIDDRMDFLALESRAPGFVRLETAARPPEIPVSGGRKRLAVVFVIGAVLLGLAVPIGLDLLDKRIKTPAQVEKILGFPPLAALVEHHGDPATRMVAADQLRRLALALERERRTGSTRCIALTAVKHGAGVSDLAFDLAREFEQNGVRTLVVEADSLQPDPRFANGPLGPGLTDVLSGECTAQEAILPAAGVLPDRIGIGITLERHLSLYGRLRQVLETLSSRYDVLLLNGPPVLMSADAEFLAGIADATLLVVGAMQVIPGELRRADAILKRADPALIGVVVTRLEVYKGAGYYKQLAKAFEQSEERTRSLLQASVSEKREA